jgi:hypothetical protein
MPIAQKSWAPAPSSAAAVMPESSLSAPGRLLKTVLKNNCIDEALNAACPGIRTVTDQIA